MEMNEQQSVADEYSLSKKRLAAIANELNYNTINTSTNTIWQYDGEDITVHELADIKNPIKPYDPYDYGCTENENSFWGTVFHIYMISSGPALLVMPKGFFEVGYFRAFVLMFIIFFLYWYNMKMIIWSEYQLCKIKHRQRMTYPETIFYSFDTGPPIIRWFAPYSRFIIQVLFVVTWIGSFELVMISSSLRVIYHSLYNVNVEVHTMMLFIFVPMLLLTWVHRLKYLVPLSIIADCISVFCILTVIFHIYIDPEPLKIEHNAGSFSAVPVFLGSTLFTLNATGLMLPLKNEMKEPRKYNSKWGVLTVTFPVISFIFAFFGLFCSLKFGHRLLPYDTVLQCLGLSKTSLQIIMSLYTLSMALQYPLITYVVFDTIWNNFLRNKQKTMKYRTFNEYLLRTLVYVVSFGAGYTIPQLNLLLSICGTIGTAVDSLIFPALINSLMMWKMYGNVRKVKLCYVKNCFILMVAVFVLYSGLFEGLSQLCEYMNDSKNNTNSTLSQFL